MKTFTITKEGLDADGFCWGIEGELATFPIAVCDTDCGCERAMVGLNSSRASTNVMVRDVALDFGDVVEAYYGHLEAGGWIEAFDGDGEAMRREAEDVIASVISGAENFDAGTVLRISYDRDNAGWRFHPVAEAR